MPAAARRRTGRPTKLGTVVDERRQQDGTVRKVTLEEHLLGDIAAGIPIARACARVGIDTDTYYDWMRKGNRSRLAPPKDPSTRQLRPLTKEERALAAFSVAAMRAEADGMARLALHVVTAATSEAVTTRTVTKTRQVGDDKVVVVETTTVRETAPPDWRAALELLQRRWPREWGRIDRHEHSGPEGDAIPLAAVVEHILGAVEETDRLYERAEAGPGGRIIELPARGLPSGTDETGDGDGRED